MSLSFADRELPQIHIKVNAKIKKAIEAYKKRRVPMKVLLTDFLAVKSKGDELADAENPWAYYYKGMEGHGVESGVSVEETVFRFAAMNIKDQKPTDVINAAFYANKKRSDSSFEIGYLIPEFYGLKKSYVNTLVVNPSPDMIYAIECEHNEGKRYYAVPDEIVAALYKLQFPESEFVSFDHLGDIYDIGAVLIINRDLGVKKAEELLSSLSCCNKNAVVVAFIPSVWFDNPRCGACHLLETAGMGIHEILIVDTKATVSTPRRKLLVIIKPGNSQTIEIGQSCFDPSNKMFSVLEETVTVNAQDYIKTKKTALSLWKNKDLSTEGTELKYQKGDRYRFSKEISLFFRIYADRKNRYAGVVYYKEIDSIEPITWGYKLSGDIEKGLRAETKEDIIKAIARIPFDDAIYPIVRTDIEAKLIKHRSLISLKTIWFYCWVYLRDLKKYDHRLISDIMQDQYIGDYVPFAQGGDEILELIAKTLRMEVEDIPYKTVEQFYMIFTSAVTHRLILYNPLENYMREYTNRATERQQDVRNALVKKHFSIEEEKAIFMAITEKQNGNGKMIPACCAKSLFLATAIRMFTGMAIREVAALTWGDIKRIEGTESYQFAITKFTDTNGKINLHSERENWKRFRIVPIATVLAYLLEERRQYLVGLGVEETYLKSYPIVMYEKNVTEIMQLKPVRHVKPIKISQSEKRLIEKANIPEQNLVLPDDVNELSSDFNRYHGDIFLSNFKHKANHNAFLTMGEINYIVGISPPDTFSRYYCDFTNDLLQEAIIQKLRRWELPYERMLGNEELDMPACGIAEGDFSLSVGPFSIGNAAVDMIIENKMCDSVKVVAECTHGLDVNKTLY